MAVVHFAPLRTFSHFRREPAEDRATAAVPREWVPAVDIHEYADRFVLLVDVPGVDPASVDLTLDQGVLIISGERPSITNQDLETFQRRERPTGNFFRRFTLPDIVDTTNVKASSKNGVLEIVIPKQAKTTPRRIVVEG